MADTLANVPLPANTWVDLYAATGIAVGTQIAAQNLADVAAARFVTKGAQPNNTDGYNIVGYGETFQNDAGASGAWAYSPNADGLINVGEV